MRNFALLSVLLLLAVSGCVERSPNPTHLKSVAFDQLRANPEAFDGKTVTIKGYIQADLLRSTSLYATADDAARNRMYDAIDILSKDIKLRKAIKYKSPTCVLASGKFRTYKVGEFKFDLPSKIGVIDLASVTPC